LLTFIYRRKGVGEQVSEKVTPDSQKSTLDKASESVSSTADKAAGALQPGKPSSSTSLLFIVNQTHCCTGDSKSTSQELSDKTRSGADDAQGEGKGVVASAQDTLSGAAQSVQDTLSGM
jgi:hypothetical protein